MDPDFEQYDFSSHTNQNNYDNYDYTTNNTNNNTNDLKDEMNTEPNYGQMSQNLRDQQALKDQQIDQLVNVAGNLKHIAGAINKDIEEEAGLLEEVHDGTKFVNDHVQDTTNKTQKVRLNGKDKMSLFIIFILILVLIAVIILAIIF